MKAVSRYHIKSKLRERYILELSIYEVGSSERYPDGVKYGLICKDLKTGRFVLFDNHHPKGPHIHVNDRQFDYEYRNDENLLEDFKELVSKVLGVKL